MVPPQTIPAVTFRVRLAIAGVVGGEKKIWDVPEGGKTTKATKSTKGTAAGGSSSVEMGEATWG